ncbi:glycosyltransferase family 4 protein [Methanocalculus sp.]|uniref:glycosyltransferase family 4 protein n=1 Tax=Methanocalculus sp. TaxID=2004547 RepID=UPI0026099484|nr:glycosyltransferase family 4 protein [Methanocalculus sp.]MDG6250110.1 glycosyltransferase family 4 protein [Methanocalculus sp.]
MDDRYQLGVFANMFPKKPEDHSGIFIKRMVDDLIDQGIYVKLAVKHNRSILGYFDFFINSLQLCLEKDIDILQAHYIPHSSIIPALFKGNRPLILKFHGDDARIFPFKSLIHQMITRWMLHRADYVLSSSEEMRKTLIGIGAKPERSAAIASGVDTDRFKPMDTNECRACFGIDRERMVFLYLGRYHPWKGIYELIEAARHFPDDLFIFAGTGALPEHPDNCINIGAIEPEKVPTLMNCADCLILPSYTEGLPNVLMEALSCSVPVIATNVGGCPEVVQDRKTGLLIAPKDTTALSEALYWMKEHPSERILMGEEGRRDMIERYEIEKLITQMIDIHRTLLEGKR